MSHRFDKSVTEEIVELHVYLMRTNPYFALWNLYKRRTSDHSVADAWRRFLLEQLGTGSDPEVEFACAMVELDKFLAIFRDQKLSLPMLLFERICLLHHIRGAERMAQTHAVLGILTAELTACTSA